MNAIELEGLIVYRTDVKQLFYRDDVTWRQIRVRRHISSVYLSLQCARTRWTNLSMKIEVRRLRGIDVHRGQAYEVTD